MFVDLSHLSLDTDPENPSPALANPAVAHCQNAWLRP